MRTKIARKKLQFLKEITLAYFVAILKIIFIIFFNNIINFTTFMQNSNYFKRW